VTQEKSTENANGTVGAADRCRGMAALLMSDEGAFITGQVISVDGGKTMRQ
jgi:hypothetical protein